MFSAPDIPRNAWVVYRAGPRYSLRSLLWAKSTPSLLLEDGHIRCQQLTLLLEWVEEFEAESHQSGEAVAFSVLLGDLNFDNCSQGKKLAQVEPRDPALPTKTVFPPQIMQRSRDINSSAVFRTPAG